MEFNELHPSITVVPTLVLEETFVADALGDIVSGSNSFDAYMTNLDMFVGALEDNLLDMSNVTVDNVNDIRWHTIGRFFRSHNSLFQGRVLGLPLAADFMALHFAPRVLDAHSLSVPRTLEELVLASMVLNGTDLNGDGVPDFGSCIPRIGRTAFLLFWGFLATYVQSRGTSHGAYFDTETLEPFTGQCGSRRGLQVVKKLAGPPQLNADSVSQEMVQYAFEGRCAFSVAPLHVALAVPAMFNAGVARIRTSVVARRAALRNLRCCRLPACHSVPRWHARQSGAHLCQRVWGRHQRADCW